jgi:RNA-directed DNA polymerase
VRFPRATHRNVYVGGPAAADRLIRILPRWIEKHLRLKVNATKSGVGRPWERKFLGFRITREGQIEVSPESLQRFKQRVRELWRGGQSVTRDQLRQQWLRYLQGWWNYYRLAEWRRPLFDLEGWIRRHMRKFFWLRWHDWRGRSNALRQLGIRYPQLKAAHSSRGAWRIARTPTLQMALSNAVLRRAQFPVPSDLAD